ncbi:MAG TPA: Ig-like domain-containing protein, partial [Burkholderiaceae bacterium]|nr:Ig-like domain-containing protein [Burkholderiaceae bacterium]
MPSSSPSSVLSDPSPVDAAPPSADRQAPPGTPIRLATDAPISIATVDAVGDTPGTAGRLSVGASLTAAIDSADDLDWYAISLTAGQSYSFSLSSTPGGLADPLLVLFDSTGGFLNYDDDGGGNLNSRLLYTAPRTGTYYLQASDIATGIGAYTLSAAVSSVSDVQPPTVVGYSPADDTTGVSVDTNLSLFFSEAIRAGTGSLVLRTASGTVVERFDVATSARLQISSNTVVVDPTAALQPGGGYVLELPAGSIRDIAGNAFAGLSSYNFTTAAASVQDDFGSTASSAGSLALGATQTGRLEQALDLDWFAVGLVAGTSYTFALNGTGSTPLGDPLLTLRNASGTVLALDDDSGPGLNSELVFTPGATGTYYLQASHYAGG